jgi:4-hydroxymandelate oxidase
MEISGRDLIRSAGLLASAAVIGSTTSARAQTMPPAIASTVNPPDLLDLTDFECAAKTVMPPMTWEYVSGAAADELTLRWNHEAYEKIRLMPRALVDVSQLDTRITLLDRELAFPILLAPTAYQKISHPDGELATVKGAGDANATMVLSTFSTVTLEEVAAAAKTPLWFQLYVQPDREFTRDLVHRAEVAGYQALVVTVDTPVLGPRYRELRAKFSPPERANLRGLKGATGAQRPPSRAFSASSLIRS